MYERCQESRSAAGDKWELSKKQKGKEKKTQQ